MNKERVRAGAGALAALLAVTGPTVAEMVTPDPIIERGAMPSQGVAGTDGEIDLSQYKTLKPGYEGPEVAVLKQRMLDLGYFKNSSSVNENFTTSTADYVKKFEKKNGLLVDGIADPEMQALFFSDKAIKADGKMVVPEETSNSEEIKPETVVNDVPEVSVEVANRPEIISIEMEKEKEVNQRFSDFLNGVGDYEDESLEWKLFRVEEKVIPDLGFVSADTNRNIVFVQSILLHHSNINGEEILAIGIKNKDGERKVSVVGWPVRSFIEISPISAVFISKTNDNGSWSKSKEYYSEEKIGMVLDKKIGSVLLMGVNIAPQKYKSMNGNKNYEISYKSLFSKKAVPNQKFFLGIWRPPQNQLSGENKTFLNSFNKTQGEILSLDNYQDFLFLDNNMFDLPYISTISYQLI